METWLKVESFEQMRREYEHGYGTIIGTAEKYGVNRRMVRQAVENAVPPDRKKPRRKRPKFEQVEGFIGQVLRENTSRHGAL
jgi:hypothetical protein